MKSVCFGEVFGIQVCLERPVFERVRSVSLPRPGAEKHIGYGLEKIDSSAKGNKALKNGYRMHKVISIKKRRNPESRGKPGDKCGATIPWLHDKWCIVASEV